MGQIYRIVAPPDPAIARRKWILVIAFVILALAVAAIIFGPGLYHAARLAAEGPGKGPVLVKRADGKIELKVPPAQVLIGKPYKWRNLGTMPKDEYEQFYVGDFDGDGNQELLWWPDKTPAVLYKPDGSATQPGLQCSDLPMADVFDWNGDGKDDLVVTKRFVPLASWPRGIIPRSYADFYGNVFLSIEGTIIGKYEHSLYDSHLKGFFTDGKKCEVAISVLLNPLLNNEETAQKLSEHPEYYLYGANAEISGTIKQFSYDCQDFFSANLDGDGLDEILTINQNGDLLECKFRDDPKPVLGWPNLTAPTATGDVDGIPGDEIVSVRPDPKTQGNFLAWALGWDENNPTMQYNDKMDKAVAAVVDLRLKDAGVAEADYSTSNNSSTSAEARWKEDVRKINLYSAQFILPDNIDWSVMNHLIAWDYERPVGFIYYPKSHTCQRLKFPKYLRWSNAWMDLIMLEDKNTVVCRPLGAKASTVFCIPSVGTGVLGFNPQGKCIYYEEFGKGVSCCGVLHTKDGDYLVLRVGNDLMIYP